MRNFWALPAVLRIALASQHSFSVFDDVLAFPQYEVVWPDTFITEEDASSLLSHQASPRPSDTPSDPQDALDLSKRDDNIPLDKTPSSNDGLERPYENVVLHGQRYLCSIPIIPEETPQNSTTSAEEAKAEEEKELMRASDRGFELLEGMQGNCIYYLSGWWSYSFCYKDEVKQFHQLPPSRGVPIYPPVEDMSTHSFILGKFPKADKGKKDAAAARKTLGNEQDGSSEALDDEGNVKDEEKGLELPRLETKGSSRYMVQRLSGGTECDLTGRPRKIDVQFHCNPQSADRIAMIKETSTCTYLMIVDTPRLCHDVAFQPPQENLAHPITCQPVIPSSQVSSWTAAKLEANLRQVENLIADHLDEVNNNPIRDIASGAEGSSPRGPMIGGIEVGGKVLVGSEGKVIEKSIVVGGGKEIYVGTVASSDGKQMSKEEMKALNIASPKDVEEVIVNLKKLAGRKGWKLNLVDTPRGREYRGIIDADSDEGGDGAEDKGEGPGKKKEKKKEGLNGAGAGAAAGSGSGSGSGSNSNTGGPNADKGKDGEGKSGGQGNEEEEEEFVQEGSEEVYKDEL